MNTACIWATTGPVDAEVRVAPVLGALGPAAPLVGDADAAGEADRAVHDQHLAVRAVVQPPQVPPLGLVIAHDLHARTLHRVDAVGVHLRAADPVEQHMHLHARPGALGQRVGKLPADRFGPVDVGLEGDRSLRLPDRLQHGRKDLVAVEQHLDRVAVLHLRAQQGAEGAAELRVVGRVLALHLLLDLLFAGGEVLHQQHPDQRDGEGGQNDPGGSHWREA